VTEAGRLGRSRGSYPSDRYERATFYFLASSTPEREPTFIRLGLQPRPAWPAGSEWNFNVAHLEACVRQPADWKARRAFPKEVVEVLGTPSPASPGTRAVPEWRRTIIDYPERLSAVLILAPAAEGREQCLAFEFQQQGWHLHAEQPVFTLGPDWSEVLPELLDEIPLEWWRESWRAWLHSRGLTDADVESCRLERSACRLRIAVPPALMDRIRAVVRPAVQGDIWLLAGEGRFRAAAHVEISVQGKSA
jgi:hypothetical protein